MSEVSETVGEPPRSTELGSSSRSSTCPYCKEAVHQDAHKCPHCQASIDGPPNHGGECPFCKETINLEAVRCRHCKSDLRESPRNEASVHPVTPIARTTSSGC